MQTIRVRKPGKLLSGKINLPSSKSISNRLLIIRAFSPERFRISNLSVSEDTKTLERLLGVIASKTDPDRIVELNTGNAGTVMRFLTGFLSITPGRWVLTGDSRMNERPIGILTEALKQLGASIEYLGTPGFPPLKITGHELNGGEISVDPGTSSQFLSSLMLIAPEFPAGLTIHLMGRPVSFSYVCMTTRLLARFGIDVIQTGNLIKINPSVFQPHDQVVEADWSGASFWYEAAALSGETDLFLAGLKKDSIQGDSVLPDLFRNLGVETGFTETGVKLHKITVEKDSPSFDLTDFPDIAPAMITTCGALGIEAEFTGIQHLRIKESDRLHALKTELFKASIHLQEKETGTICSEGNAGRMETGSSSLSFKTYDDHRLAMTFAPLAMKFHEVMIEAPDVVKKSYPGFWEDLSSAGFEIS
jgi:3-phosphoshikimate 1-carboxyvinyltransferase